MAIKQRTCIICGNRFYVPSKQATRLYCDRKECQLERRRRNNAKKRQLARLKSRKSLHSSSHRKIDAGRKCRRCGKNAYPNYFFCPECHQIVSRHEWKKDSKEADGENL